MAAKLGRQLRNHPASPGRTFKKLGKAALPQFIEPMLCTLAAEPFDNPAWVFEPKFDGLRILGRYDGRQLLLLSRNLLSRTTEGQGGGPPLVCPGRQMDGEERLDRCGIAPLPQRSG
jgi:ATP-dependent DNA ligase